MKTFTALVMAFSCGIFLGCGAEPNESGDEVVGEAKLEVGEATCASAATADDTIAVNCGNNYESISSDGTYGQTDCPGQYVVEFTGSPSAIDSYGQGWGDTLPTSSGTCGLANVWVSAWQHKNGSWTQLGTTDHKTGSWNSGTSTCSFANPTSIASPDASGVDKVRVAVRAFQCSQSLCLSGTTKKARAFVFGSACK